MSAVGAAVQLRSAIILTPVAPSDGLGLLCVGTTFGISWIPNAKKVLGELDKLGLLYKNNNNRKKGRFKVSNVKERLNLYAVKYRFLEHDFGWNYKYLSWLGLTLYLTRGLNFTVEYYLYLFILN